MTKKIEIINAAEEEVKAHLLSLDNDTEKELKLDIQVSPGTWAQILDLILEVIQVAKKYALDDEGNPRKIRLIDFILKPELRAFTVKMIFGILAIIMEGFSVKNTGK